MSRSFKARTSHTADNPQLCGLGDITGCHREIDGLGQVANAIQEGDECFYLTCRGSDAQPTLQIERSAKRDDYDTLYRVTPSGKTRTVGKGAWTKQVPIFKWQEWSCDSGCRPGSGTFPAACAKIHKGGGWHDVTVWEKMVHEDCAASTGYRTPNGKVTARVGDRTRGYAHSVAKNAESPFMDLARAAESEEPEESEEDYDAREARDEKARAPKPAPKNDGLDWLDGLY